MNLDDGEMKQSAYYPWLCFFDATWLYLQNLQTQPSTLDFFCSVCISSFFDPFWKTTKLSLDLESENFYVRGLRGCHVMSYHVKPWYTMLYHLLPCHTMLLHVILCFTMSYNVIQCHIISYHILPYHTMSYHVIHVIPCNTMLYHAYHVIQCYTMQCHVILCYNM